MDRVKFVDSGPRPAAGDTERTTEPMPGWVPIGSICVLRRWIPWATLPKRVFQADVMGYPTCSSRMQRIAVIHDPKTIQAILECITRKTQPP